MEPQWPKSARLLCSWDFPGKNPGPFPSPGGLPNSGIEPVPLALAGGFSTTEPPGKPPNHNIPLGISKLLGKATLRMYKRLFIFTLSPSAHASSSCFQQSLLQFPNNNFLFPSSLVYVLIEILLRKQTVLYSVYQFNYLFISVLTHGYWIFVLLHEFWSNITAIFAN